MQRLLQKLALWLFRKSFNLSKYKGGEDLK